MVKAEYIIDNEKEIKEICMTLGYSRKNKKRNHIIFLVFTVAICIINIISKIISNSEADFFSWGLITFLLIWKIYEESNIYQNILNNSRQRRLGNKCIYSFGDGGIIVDKVGNSFSENTNYGYDLITKAVETDEYFCWEYRKSVFDAVKKSAIFEGSAHELRSLFETHLGDKFVIKVK